MCRAVAEDGGSEANEEMVGCLWDRTNRAGGDKLLHMGDEVQRKRGVNREVTLNTELLPKAFSLLKKEPQAGNGCDSEDRVECWQ